MRHILLPALLFVLSIVAQAQIYKWVDKNGHMQYSDLPPPSDVTQDNRGLSIQSMPPRFDDNNKTNTGKSLSEEKLEFEKRQLARREAENKRQIEAEENKKKCNEAQGRLKIFRESPRLTIPDGKGGIVYVDSHMRDEKIEKAKKNIAAYCN
ncbi:protein of unknown function [Nitrosomonas cryotolerans]|uniref:DUF4124 domain-containing protein n=1 Tax=Nitrosomonas cryotolerans ATCC 49181 TaxID=1131553 RepID=A0A1N6HZM7_9PROT|nr:DUF4124 domain-containing protein [Nitrosomonas cryotolerans]SFQ09364.1 protein of unknown function [Nitrosomonas cryotolerans]SIO25268.1 protein of unknown function [Nitrosomonas cryotolerans ATCC 49181]